jgi:uncharacterized protein (TIGR02145 family)
MTKNRIIFNMVIMGIIFLTSSCNGGGSIESSSQNASPNQDESSNQNASSNLDEVTIGSQVWTSTNLDVSTFRNGDPIPQSRTNEEWKKAGENGEPAWCYYDNDPSNGTKYGKLYNWHAVNDPRGLAPNGYHIPTDAEWTKLSDCLGGEDLAGTKMKSKSGWKENNGTNSSGFSGLPGGRCSNGSFGSIGCNGYWWSSTETRTYSVWIRNLLYDYGGVISFYDSKVVGLSVRCLRD